MKIDANLKGLKQHLQKMEDEKAKLLLQVDEVIEARANEMATMAKRLAPVDMGGLRANTGYKKNGFLSYELYSNLFYAPYIEFGTKTYVKVPPELKENAEKARQQKNKGDFGDFILALAKWVRRKGLAGTAIKRTKTGKVRKDRKATESNEINLAYQIAYVIMKKGIKRQPFIYPAFMMYKNKLINDVAKLMK